MSTRSIQDHSPEKYVSMSFRVRNKYAQLVHEAAAKATGRDNGTASYMRELVLNNACDVLGIPRVDVSTMDLPSDGVAQAAKLANMSPDEFMHMASRELAATLLKQAGKLPSGGNSSPSGSYAKTIAPKSRRK